MTDITVYTNTWNHIMDYAATPFEFPGGEQHLKVEHEFDVTSSQSDIWYGISRGARSDELIQLGMMSDVALRRGDYAVAALPYFPAARSDRGEPTGGSVYGDMINAFQFGAVIVLDPHSEFVTDYIDNVIVADFLPLLTRAIGQRKFDGIIAPDAGAVDRATRVAEALGVPVHTAKKSRDFATGKITRIDAPVLSSQGSYLVVDDICDGGGTFRGLADALDLPRDRLSLWVTHGVFSGKAPDLRQDYGWIGTTDSHPGSHKPNVANTIVPVAHAMFHTAREGFKP